VPGPRKAEAGRFSIQRDAVAFLTVSMQKNDGTHARAFILDHQASLDDSFTRIITELQSKKSVIIRVIRDLSFILLVKNIRFLGVFILPKRTLRNQD
jgi:hypothetical protein